MKTNKNISMPDFHRNHNNDVETIEKQQAEIKRLRDALEAIDRLDEVSVYDQATKSICIAQEALKESE